MASTVITGTPLRPSTPENIPVIPASLLSTPRRRKTPRSSTPGTSGAKAETPSAGGRPPSWPRTKKRVSEETLVQATTEVFGYSPRGWQLRVVLRLLEGHDVIVIAGTGAGKSLIFGMLAIASALLDFDGVVLVVCPLKALQMDQVRTGQQITVTAYLHTAVVRSGG